MKQGYWSTIKLTTPAAKRNEITTTMIRLIGCANRLPPARRVLATGPEAITPAATGSEKRPKLMNKPGR